MIRCRDKLDVIDESLYNVPAIFHLSSQFDLLMTYRFIEYIVIVFNTAVKNKYLLTGASSNVAVV